MTRNIVPEITAYKIQFWAVMGSRGCREKNPNCHKYATFEILDLGGLPISKQELSNNVNTYSLIENES